MAGYKIYAAEVTQLGAVGVIITSTFENAGGYPHAESFLLIPDGQTLYPKMIRFDVKSFEDSPVELTEDFMLEEALQQAKLDLGMYLRSRHESGGYPPPPNSPNVSEANANLLVHVWVRGTCPHIKEVYNKTKYDDLAAALKPILNMPVLQRAEL